MNIEEIRSFCLLKKECTECLPFDDTLLVFKVLGKMFALIDLNNPTNVTLKCDPDYALDLKDMYNAVQPAWHFNKRYWINIQFNLDVNDALILDLVSHSYEQVVKKMPKRQQLLLQD